MDCVGIRMPISIVKRLLAILVALLREFRIDYANKPATQLRLAHSH
jgi:hypothetical protein